MPDTESHVHTGRTQLAGRSLCRPLTFTHLSPEWPYCVLRHLAQLSRAPKRGVTCPFKSHQCGHFKNRTHQESPVAFTDQVGSPGKALCWVQHGPGGVSPGSGAHPSAQAGGELFGDKVGVSTWTWNQVCALSEKTAPSGGMGGLIQGHFIPVCTWSLQGMKSSLAHSGSSGGRLIPACRRQSLDQAAGSPGGT